MTEKLQIYKCAVCGNIAEMVHAGAGQMVCCGQPMTLFKENTTDAAKEKHLPVIERTAEGLKVKVGSVPHPGMVHIVFILIPGTGSFSERCPSLAGSM